MLILSAILGILILILLVAWFKLDTFISFIIVCLLVGLSNGLSLTQTVEAIQKGIGSTLSSLTMILVFGAMLGKLVAESGAAKLITERLVSAFGIKNIQLALILTGFIVGIPMFYTVGFVILVPLVIAIAHNTKLPLLYIGLPMLASLSVTHGFLPPHPAPTAIAELYGADMGLTLMYGILVGIPAIISAKFFLSGTMKRIQPTLLKDYIVEQNTSFPTPPLAICLFVASLPVLLIGVISLLAKFYILPLWLIGLGEPAIAMLLAVLAAIYFLGIRTGRRSEQVMGVLPNAITSVAVVLLIIAGAGAFKEVMVATGVSDMIGQRLGSLGMSPILLAWLIAALIRISVGSATVAALTGGSIMAPMIASSGVAPELLVLATGAGSITLSHINDGGFWLFKEYFNVTIKETLLSWTLMETTVSIVGLIGTYILHLIIS